MVQSEGPGELGNNGEFLEDRGANVHLVHERVTLQCLAGAVLHLYET